MAFVYSSAVTSSRVGGRRAARCGLYTARSSRVRASQCCHAVRLMASMESSADIAAIEDAFVEACVPGEKSYEEALCGFIDTVMVAYRAGFSLQALLFELQSRQVSAKITLKTDELEFRTVWVTIVYKTLRHLKVPCEQGAHVEEVFALDDSFDVFIRSVHSLVLKGYDLQRIQLEQSMNQTQEARTDFETAVLRQSTRLVYYTVKRSGVVE